MAIMELTNSNVVALIQLSKDRFKNAIEVEGRDKEWAWAAAVGAVALAVNNGKIEPYMRGAFPRQGQPLRKTKK